MSDPVNLEVHRGNRKKACIYCGGDEHAAHFACPRIETIWLSDEGKVEAIDFREGWEPPKLAG